MSYPVLLTERVELRLSKAQREKLDRIAKAEDRTPSQVMRRLIDKAPEPAK